MPVPFRWRKPVVTRDKLATLLDERNSKGGTLGCCHFGGFPISIDYGAISAMLDWRGVIWDLASVAHSYEDSSVGTFFTFNHNKFPFRWSNTRLGLPPTTMIA